MNEKEQKKPKSEKQPYEKPELIHLSEIHEKTDGLFASLFRAS